jgi:hypothetical protein
MENRRFSRMKTLLMIEFGEARAADIVEREVGARLELHVQIEKMPMPKIKARGGHAF